LLQQYPIASDDASSRKELPHPTAPPKDVLISDDVGAHYLVTPPDSDGARRGLGLVAPAQDIIGK
jgi:hypothetical protein